MAMIVKHNLQAMNSNRMLGINSSTLAKSTEKLSSGYKINRAADDAAGLAISEKMRKQIRGLSQASLNAQDGISAVQTAEGALNEVQDMLQRMNELAVKASNGTNSESDRQAIQDEIDQLVTEIDRVAETTKFNETYLLKGESASNGNAKTFATGDVLGTVDGLTVEAKGTTAAKLVDAAKVTLGTVQMESNNANVTIANADQAGCKAANVVKVVSDGAGKATVTLNDGKEVTDTVGNIATNYGITISDTAVESAIISKGLKAETANATIKGDYTGNVDGLAVGDTVKATLAVGPAGASALSSDDKALLLTFQVGADTTQENKIDVALESMSAKSLGVDGLKVNGLTSLNADNAVTTIANALTKVSTQRSALGAVQNRLEHTIANLDNVVENTTSAEAQIRDTDMATEMVKYSNNNILAQAGQAMLAQANQANQGVLSLLG